MRNGPISRDMKNPNSKLNFKVLRDQLHNNMPPRLPSLTAHVRAAHTSSPFIACLMPFLQVRNASILSSLSDNPGAYNKRIRRGRGPSSGKGKTSGRGHKGQKQHGKVPARFQGGQTPQEIVHGERGFNNQYATTQLPP